MSRRATSGLLSGGLEPGVPEGCARGFPPDPDRNDKACVDGPADDRRQGAWKVSLTPVEDHGLTSLLAVV